MENNWHEKLFDFSSNPSYITITCVGIEPRTTGCKSDTLTRDYLPALKSMVNIILKYVTLKGAFHRWRHEYVLKLDPICSGIIK